MKPVEFAEQNLVMGEGQPQYLPLPAYREDGGDGRVISCWSLTWKERWRLLWSGRMWLTICTFGMRLQPLLPQVDSPFKPRPGEPK